MLDWIDRSEDTIRDVDWGNVTITHHRQAHATVGVVIRRSDTYRVATLPEGLDLVGTCVMEAATNRVTGTLEFRISYDDGRIKSVYIDQPV